jgi:hypothetical protein
MLDNKIKLSNFHFKLIFPKSLLQFFRARPPFFLKVSFEYRFFFYFYVNYKSKQRDKVNYKTNFSFKKFSSNFAKYSNFFKKKNIALKRKKMLPFLEKNLVFHLESLNKKNKISQKYLKNIFSINFSRFFIFQNISRWKEFSYKKKIFLLVDLIHTNCFLRKIDKF